VPEPVALPSEEMLPELERAFRSSLTGADAYKAARQAVRVEKEVLRIGNRFVPADGFREIAFLAVGRAAVSLAYAFVDGLGDALTQGYVAGPDAVPDEIPFQHRRVASGAVGSDDGPAVAEAALEMAGALGPKDLLLVALSPGALGLLALPPRGLGPDAYRSYLQRLREGGATGPELERFVRATSEGAAGGRLAAAGGARIVPILVDRGGAVEAMGGGPTQLVTLAERQQARASALAHAGPGPLPAELVRVLDAPATSVSRLPDRPVIVTSPTDALEGASDGLSEIRWWSRLAALKLTGAPEAAAPEFLRKVDEVLPTIPKSRDKRSGIAILAGAELDLLDGEGEGSAARRLIERLQRENRRRDLTLGVFRTGGPRGGAEFCGAFGDARTPELRPIPAASAGRPGITDVGPVVIALLPEAKEP
jgi:glycerate-2-kinase